MFKNTLQTGRTLLACAIATCGIVTGNAWAVDREYQQGENVVADIPVANFQISGDQVISEKDGLVWSRCLVGQTYTSGVDDVETCTGDATEFDSWEAALGAVTPEQKADGWRVANIKELMRITDNRYIFPAINSELFPFAKGLKYNQKNDYGLSLLSGSSPYMWSSTPKRHVTTREKNWTTITKEESQTLTEEDGKEYQRVLVLDMSDGNIIAGYRDGKSRGEHETTQYSAPDPDHVEKARYVLLVKTYTP